MACDWYRGLFKEQKDQWENIRNWHWNISEEDTQKLKKYKKNQICSKYHKELQQRIEHVMENMKDIPTKVHRLKNPAFFILLKNTFFLSIE